MNFTFAHFNINVIDLQRSIDFYNKALGLEICDRKVFEEEGFELVYMKNSNSSFIIELTWLRDHPEPYNLGENEIHFAFTTDDYEAAYAHHKEMDCIVFENDMLGLYFIVDPDGFWIEIIPPGR